MLHLAFRSSFIRFIVKTKSVHLIAEYDGKPISILISRRVIEYLADASDLDRDQSFTTVVRNKECLQVAAERAIERYGNNFHAIAVELADVKLAGIKVAPMVVSRTPGSKGSATKASRAPSASPRAPAEVSQSRTR